MTENRKGCVLGTRRCTPADLAQEIECQWHHDPKIKFGELCARARAQRATMSRKTNGTARDLPIDAFVATTLATGNMRPLQALCLELGGVFVPAPQAEADGVDDVVVAFFALVESFGDNGSTVRAIVADGVVDDLEATAARQKLGQLMALAANLEAVITRKVARPSLLTSARVLA